MQTNLCTISENVMQNILSKTINFFCQLSFRLNNISSELPITKRKEKMLKEVNIKKSKDNNTFFLWGLKYHIKKGISQ